MAGAAGWYIGRIDTASVASVKGGGQVQVSDTVFKWTDNKAKPTVDSAGITGLVAITGGPYPTQAAAQKAAEGDPATHPGIPGTGTKVPVTVSTAGSSGGTFKLPNPLSGIQGFLADITSANLWIRVAKVIIGGAILLTGLAKMTGAGGIAAKAVKVAPLL